jgi:hypothetical protein
MIELMLPDEWSEEKKAEFRKSVDEKIGKKLKPLIDAKTKDREKSKENKDE